jgi:hypothetical protein
MDTKSNEIRTILLLKINSEIDIKNNKIEFKSLSNKKNVIENYEIEFNEFYQGYENNFISNNFFQFESPISELDTNPTLIKSNKINEKKEKKIEKILPLKYLQSLSEDLKSNKPLKRKLTKSKTC